MKNVRYWYGTSTCSAADVPIHSGAGGGENIAGCRVQGLRGSAVNILEVRGPFGGTVNIEAVSWNWRSKQIKVRLIPQSIEVYRKIQ